MAAKKVFETNLDTVHQIACWNRDQHGDASNFENLRQSRLHQESYGACRIVFRKSMFWWLPERVTITDDGQATVLLTSKIVKNLTMLKNKNM